MLNLIFKNAQRNIDVLDFSSLNNKKILLTGTTGLIGVHLLSTLILLKKIYNIEIYCLTNDNIDEMFLPLYKDCFIIKGNLVNSKSIDKLLDILQEVEDEGKKLETLIDPINTEIENIETVEKIEENKDILKEKVILNEKNKLLNKFSEFHLEKIKKKYLINLL